MNLLSDSVWALSGKLINAALVIVVSGLLARLLSPDDMGAYFLALSLVSGASVLASLGLDKAVIRFVARALSHGDEVGAAIAIRKIYLYCIIASILIAIGLVVGVGKWLALNLFESASMANVIGLMSIWVFFFTLRSLLAETFRGFRDIRLAVLFEGLLKNLLSALFLGLILVIVGKADLNLVLAWLVTAVGITVLIGGLLLSRKMRLLVEESSIQNQVQGGEILAFAWPVLITNLTVFILTRSDIWIIGTFRSEQEVAIYGAVAQLVALVALPLAVANAIIPPVITEMHTQGKKQELESTLRRVASVTGIPALLILILFILLGGPILAIVFDDYYSQGALILALLSVGQLVNVFVGSCGMALIMTGNQATMMRVTVFSGILTILGTIMVVRSYGTTGVAIVTTLTLSLQNIMNLLLTKKKIGVWTHMQFSINSVRAAFLKI